MLFPHFFLQNNEDFSFYAIKIEHNVDEGDGLIS